MLPRLSVASRSSVETAGRIELDFCTQSTLRLVLQYVIMGLRYCEKNCTFFSNLVPNSELRRFSVFLSSRHVDRRNCCQLSTSDRRPSAVCRTERPPVCTTRWRVAACCGRYKKYRLRCAGCWHIPRKQWAWSPVAVWLQKTSLRCQKCGLHLSQQHRQQQQQQQQHSPSKRSLHYTHGYLNHAADARQASSQSRILPGGGIEPAQ